MSLGAGYLLAVHWYGLRHGRGAQLILIWVFFLALALLMSGSFNGGAEPDCEWGRYAQPC